MSDLKVALGQYLLKMKGGAAAAVLVTSGAAGLPTVKDAMPPFNMYASWVFLALLGLGAVLLVFLAIREAIRS